MYPLLSPDEIFWKFFVIPVEVTRCFTNIWAGRELDVHPAHQSVAENQRDSNCVCNLAWMALKWPLKKPERGITPPFFSSSDTEWTAPKSLTTPTLSFFCYNFSQYDRKNPLLNSTSAHQTMVGFIEFYTERRTYGSLKGEMTMEEFNTRPLRA